MDTTQPRTFPNLKSIATLTDHEIRRELSNDELIAIIRGADYPFAGKERLEFFDADTLQRVVFLVRRWAQNRRATGPVDRVTTSD